MKILNYDNVFNIYYDMCGGYSEKTIVTDDQIEDNLQKIPIKYFHDYGIDRNLLTKELKYNKAALFEHIRSKLITNKLGVTPEIQVRIDEGKF